MSGQNLVGVSEIQTMIIELRGQKVMLDSDLAALYQVSTKRLNEQVKRNIKRFPSDFMFRLTEEEKKEVVANCDHLRSLRFSAQLPYVFTRNGANMLSAILRSPIAIQRSIQVMRAFSALEDFLNKNKKLLAKSPEIMTKLDTHSKAIMHLFHQDEVKANEIKKVKGVLKEMIKLLQKMVFRLP